MDLALEGMGESGRVSFCFANRDELARSSREDLQFGGHNQYGLRPVTTNRRRDRPALAPMCTYRYEPVRLKG